MEAIVVVSTDKVIILYAEFCREIIYIAVALNIKRSIEKLLRCKNCSVCKPEVLYY